LKLDPTSHLPKYSSSLYRFIAGSEKYETREEAKRSIFKYIEIFYKRTRIHSAIGGLSPEQFEEMRKLA